MQKKLLLALSALIITFTGCETPQTSTEVPFDGKSFLFVDTTSGQQAFYEGEHNETTALSTTELNGTLFYFHHEHNGTQEELAAYLKSSFNFATDGNATLNDVVYVGHPEGEGFHLEVDFNNSDELASLNTQLADNNTSQVKVAQALASFTDSTYTTDDLCTFFIPEHNDTTGGEYYAVSKDAKVFIFHEENSTLNLEQANIVLEGATTCEANNVGITAAADGVYVFLQTTQTIYLVDAHGSATHQHAKYALDEFLTTNINPTQMVGFGEGAHDDHAY